MSIFRIQRAKRKIKKLSKTAVVLKDNYTTRYEIEGPRTYGYLDMWASLNAAFDLVYPKGFMSKFIYGVFFTESAEKVFVHIITPRPGMVIGLYGDPIDQLTNWLKKCFGKETEIKLQESETLLGMQSHENY